MSKFPDFIIVGAMKCGTTVMWHNMNNHPGITMGKNWEDPKKASTEIRFWNNGEPYYTWKNGFDWYKNLFSGECCGEKCANYIESVVAMKRISQNIPNVKIILNVRNPIDRIYSEFNMMKKTSPKRYRQGFRKIVRRDRGMIEKGMYFKQVQRKILSFFSRENLYISIQERMAADVNKELNAVYDFLGVDRINKDVENISDKSKDIFIDNYKKWHSEYPPMKQPEKEHLKRLYGEANKRFFGFIGEEINEWKS